MATRRAPAKAAPKIAEQATPEAIDPTPAAGTDSPPETAPAAASEEPQPLARSVPDAVLLHPFSGASATVYVSPAHVEELVKLGWRQP